MRTVGPYEAKTHLPRLLEDVARGETITITKHGVPIARLVPAGTPRDRDVHEVIAELKRFRKGRLLGDTTVGELIREGPP